MTHKPRDPYIPHSSVEYMRAMLKTTSSLLDQIFQADTTPTVTQPTHKDQSYRATGPATAAPGIVITRILLRRSTFSMLIQNSR